VVLNPPISQDLLRTLRHEFPSETTKPKKPRLSRTKNDREPHLHVKKTWHKTLCGSPVALRVTYPTVQEAKDSPAACIWGWKVCRTCKRRSK